MTGVVNTMKKVWTASTKKGGIINNALDPGGFTRGRALTANSFIHASIDPAGTFTKQDNRINQGLPFDKISKSGSSMDKPGGYEQIAQEEADAQAAVDKLNATPPTINAANNAARQQSDRLRRRRGVLANIYGGSSTPSVGQKVLLGS